MHSSSHVECEGSGGPFDSSFEGHSTWDNASNTPGLARSDRLQLIFGIACEGDHLLDGLQQNGADLVLVAIRAPAEVGAAVLQAEQVQLGLAMPAVLHQLCTLHTCMRTKLLQSIRTSPFWLPADQKPLKWTKESASWHENAGLAAEVLRRL